jgi:hypothetical protein
MTQTYSVSIFIPHTSSCNQCSAVQCSAVQCILPAVINVVAKFEPLGECTVCSLPTQAVTVCTVQCSAVQCSAVQCSAVQCSAVTVTVQPANPGSDSVDLRSEQGNEALCTTLQSAQCTVQCSMCNVHCAPCTVHCAVYTALHSAHCAVLGTAVGKTRGSRFVPLGLLY